MKYAFITGIPACGKSYLAEKVAKSLDIQHIDVDSWREEMSSDPELKKWVDFFFNLDEKKYWHSTTADEQWQNLVKQSEVFWPVISKKIKEIQTTGKATIFEGVNLLPHLISQLDIKGILLLGESYQTILDRNKKDPRWGNTEELQILEAKAFWEVEQPRYKAEAEKYNLPIFSDATLAEDFLLEIFN